MLAGSEILELILNRSIVVETPEGKIDTAEKISKVLKIRPTKWDLQVGNEYCLFSEVDHVLGDTVRSLPAGGFFVIRPGDTVIVKSREKISMPPDLAGFITAKVGLATIGLSNISTPLDPNFSGYLTLTITNLGGYDVKLGYGDIVCGAQLFKMDKPVIEKFHRDQPDDLAGIIKAELAEDELQRRVSPSVLELESRSDFESLLRQPRRWRPVYQFLQQLDAKVEELWAWVGDSPEKAP